MEQQDQSGPAAADVSGANPWAPAADHPIHKVRKHKARIEHSIPGRIRMKVPAGKNDPGILEAYREAFSLVPGILQVTTRPDTGSIVIQYDPEQEHHMHAHLGAAQAEHRPDNEVAEVASQIEAEAEFLAEHSEFAKAALDFFRSCDRELKIATDNTIDLKIVLAGGLAAFTFLEIGAEAATPMWVTLALFSLNHFAELQHHQMRPAPILA